MYKLTINTYNDNHTKENIKIGTIWSYKSEYIKIIHIKQWTVLMDMIITYQNISNNKIYILYYNEFLHYFMPYNSNIESNNTINEKSINLSTKCRYCKEKETIMDPFENDLLSIMQEQQYMELNMVNVLCCECFIENDNNNLVCQGGGGYNQCSHGARWYINLNKAYCKICISKYIY